MTADGGPGEQGLALDRERALELTPVSRETLARLDRFVGLLLEWRTRLNLIAESTVGSLWTRHIADSLQLLPLAQDARTFIDLGSGAGFPGLIIACALPDDSAFRVHLVENNMKKVAFLREAVRITAVPVTVHPVKIGDFTGKFRESPQIVMARALAPLEQLLDAAYPLLKRGAVGLFPKGRNVGAELTEATRYWNIDASLIPSMTDPNARIVVVRNIERAVPPSGASHSA